MEPIFEERNIEKFFQQPDGTRIEVIAPKLSGMNGIELAIRLCAEMPNCKTLLISGQTDTANLLEEARQRGFDFAILAKPVLPTELINKAVQMVGEEH